MKMRILKFLLFCLASFGSLAQLQGSGLAEEYQPTPCDEAQYSAIVTLQSGVYDIHMRAGRKEDISKGKIYYKYFDEGICEEIGSIFLKTKTYQKAGDLNLSKNQNTINLYVRLDSTSDKYAGASTPQIVFSEKGKEPCDLTKGCIVTYEDQEFTLSPKKISLSMDTLRVGLLLPLDKNVKEVLYTVDGKPAYKSSELEKFNLKYVPDGQHTVSRNIILKDGQTLYDSEIVQRGLEGGITYLIISLFYRQSKLLIYLGIVLVLLIIYSVAAIAIKHLTRRRRWKKEHFFDPNEHFDTSNAGANRSVSNDESFGQLYRSYKKYIISGFILFSSLYIFSIYGLTIFRVDGVSMMPTLKDKSRRLLYTLPVSVGKINGSYYLPSRGDVVVVEKDENNLFEAIKDSEKQYVVKRVIALPNERVVLKDGEILVFNKENEKGFEPDSSYKWISDLTGSESIVLDIRLGAGEIFVVGDNRDESIDSRFYGPVSTSLVVGKVL